MGISHTDVLSCSYILPNNNSIHIDPNQVNQSKDTNTLCNTCLWVRMQNKQDLLGIYQHMSLSNHRHKSLMDNLWHKCMLSYLHIKLDFKGILLHISKLNYLHMIQQDIVWHISLKYCLQKNQLGIHSHKK